MTAAKYVVVAVVAAVVALFALQNNGPISIRFVVWTLHATPLASLVLLSAAAGIVLVGVPLWVERWRLRARVRALETRLAAIEARQAEKGTAPGAASAP